MTQARPTINMRPTRRGAGGALAVLAAVVLAGNAQAQCEVAAAGSAALGAAATPPASASTVAPSPAAPGAPAALPPAAPAVDTAALLATVPKVTAAGLLARLSKPDPSLLLLDVRSPEEYAAGHIPGARNLMQGELEGRLAELQVAKDAGQEIVLYCRSGRRAALALQTLRAAGFSKIAHLEGDFQGWEAKGHDVARSGASTPPPGPCVAPSVIKPE